MDGTKELGWISLYDRWNFHKCLTVFRCLKGFCPSYLKNLFCLNSDVHDYNTRNRSNIHMTKIASNSGYRSFSYSAAKLYNHLSPQIKNSNSIHSFTANYWLELGLK